MPAPVVFISNITEYEIMNYKNKLETPGLVLVLVLIGPFLVARVVVSFRIGAAIGCPPGAAVPAAVVFISK